MTSGKVLIIGLDGATLDLMRPWMDAGLLPNLAELTRDGSSGPLESTLHPITGAAWPSFMTGTQQGKHGVYDFIRRVHGSYRFALTNCADIGLPTIFEITSRQGKRVIAFNVPVTFPPRPVNGVMISGLFAHPSPAIAAPVDLYTELVRLVGEYVIMPRYNRYARQPLGDYIIQLCAMSDKHAEAMLYLMRKDAWDLACAVFTEIDLAQHAFWEFMDSDDPRYGAAILDAYRHLDTIVGRLRDAAGPDTLTLIMSDHGAGPLESFVQLNRWLSDEGLLSFLPARTGRRAQFIRAAWRAWRRWVPPKLIASVRARIGARYDDMRDHMESTLFATRINWSTTRAYALGACGNIFINLAGREPQGIVQPGQDYESTRDYIRGRLMALVDPATGKQIVADVLRREDVYHGRYVENAPDLIVTWRDYRYWGRGRYDFDGPDVFHRQRAWDFSELPLTGTHRMNGVIAVAGPGVRSACSPANARIIDVAPTVLATLGIPIPNYMDGRVLTEIFRDGELMAEVSSVEDGDVVSAVGYTPSEAAEIEERLKGLGYL